jgi:exodeoxyribonuclease X
MELLFLDTETTGTDLTRDRLCQISYQTKDGIQTGLFKPPVPISVKAMSITHITNEMVADQPSFQESPMYAELEKLLDNHILVAHNAPFDVAMLTAEGLKISNYICTLRLVSHLDQDASIPEYNLQYLRYFLKLNVTNANAHDAEGDVLVLAALFDRLMKKMLETTPDQTEALNQMIAISQQPFLRRIFKFGKYRGAKISDIAQQDPGYLEWLLQQKIADGDPNDPDTQTWIYSLKHHLGRTT